MANHGHCGAGTIRPQSVLLFALPASGGPGESQVPWHRGSSGIPLALRLVRRIAMDGIANGAVMCLLALHVEAGIMRRPIHDERESDRLTALAAIVGAHADVMVRV